MFPSPPPPPNKNWRKEIDKFIPSSNWYHPEPFHWCSFIFFFSFWVNLGWLSKFVLITWRQNSRPRKVQILPTKQLQSTRYIWTEKHTKPKLSEVCVNWNCISWYCLLSEITPIIEYRCLNQCKFNLPHSSFNYPPPPPPPASSNWWISEKADLLLSCHVTTTIGRTGQVQLTSGPTEVRVIARRFSPKAA